MVRADIIVAGPVLIGYGLGGTSRSSSGVAPEAPSLLKPYDVVHFVGAGDAVAKVPLLYIHGLQVNA